MSVLKVLLPVLLACSTVHLVSPEEVYATSTLDLSEPFEAGEHQRDFELDVPVTGRYRVEIGLCGCGGHSGLGGGVSGKRG